MSNPVPDTIIYIDPDQPMNLQNQIRQKLVDGILNGSFGNSGQLCRLQDVTHCGGGGVFADAKERSAQEADEC